MEDAKVTRRTKDKMITNEDTCCEKYCTSKAKYFKETEYMNFVLLFLLCDAHYEEIMLSEQEYDWKYNK